MSDSKTRDEQVSWWLNYLKDPNVVWLEVDPRCVQDATGFAETAESYTPGTQPAENINQAPGAEGGEKC